MVRGPLDTCIAWGPLRPGELEHLDCPVILYDASAAAVPVTVSLPACCPCECTTCKRAWWKDGRPRVRNGKVERG